MRNLLAGVISWQRRRPEVLLLYTADGSVSSIAQLLQVHRNTVSTDLREFARHGLSALSRARKLGAPPRLSKQQIAAIWRLADQAPPPWVCRWAAGPYPVHSRPAFAFSLVLYPPPLGLLLRVAFPCGETTGLPRSADVSQWEGRSASPVVRHLRRGICEPPNLTTYLLVQA